MDEEDAHFTHNSSRLGSLCDGKGGFFCLFFFPVTHSFNHLEQQNTFIKGAVCKNWLPAKFILGNNKHNFAAPERWCCLLIRLSSYLRK